ncbi:MAG: cobalamin biosynthesis protein CobW, partial [Clostridia bacterium]|nr:cobalamin biosynthesis protein CobW [Clostridia bacterium]
DELMTGRFGMVLRAKGIVRGDGGEWIHFDYVPGDADVRTGSADVIGTGLDKDGLKKLFTPENN